MICMSRVLRRSGIFTLLQLSARDDQAKKELNE
jgi:hypothetical protein